MSDVMTGHERLAVTANDTLERILTGVRAAEGADLVLDVDEHSPLLLSLQQLHSLDEVAQEYNVRLTIATANSKLLNAARVFGLNVIDARATPTPSGEVGPARHLAGQPLDRREMTDAQETPPAYNRVGEELPRVRLATPTRPSHEDDTDDIPWSPPIHPQARSNAIRLDPYGQPYDDGEGVASTGERRALHSRGLATDPDTEEPDEGWDDGSEDNEADASSSQRVSLRERLNGGGSFWQDVRAWVAARRQPTVTVAEPLSPGEIDDEEGWDEPLLQGHPSGSLASVAHRDATAAGWGDDEDQEPASPPPRRLSRSRAPISDLDEDDEGERREPTARLPIVPPVIAYNADEGYDDDAYIAAAQTGHERRRGPVRLLTGGLLFAIAAAATAVLLILYLLLPTATVTLVARTGQVGTNFKVIVGEIDPTSPQGQATSERIVIPAQRLIVPLNASATKAATGARLEPDTTAGGPVVLTNPSTTAVTVARGTTLTADDGREYVTQEGVTIGPADPFGAEAFGSATVSVAAGIRGSGGNAPVGTVRGQLANGIYYTNKTAPIAGGSDRRIPTIVQQDIAAARAAAEEAARGKGPAALTAAIPAGGTVMHDTSGVGNYKTTTNLQVGADGTSVTATTAAEVTALVYTPANVEAQARAEAEKRINAAVKPGEPIVAGSVQIAAPQVVEDLPGQLTYQITGTAQTRAAIGTESERAALAQALAHQDDDQAHAILAALPGVSSTRIDYQTGPFPQRMPWLPSHITVRIADGR